MTSPQVTIAIPTRNRLAYLRDAVASAQAQTYLPLEIVISDNASSDGTREYLSTLSYDPRIRVLLQGENIGMTGNWDACLQHATGAWFLLLSDDDVLEAAALEKMVVAANDAHHPSRVGLVYCLCRTIDAAGREMSRSGPAPRQESAQSFALAYFNRRRTLFPCGTMLRSADLLAGGGYTGAGVQLGCDAIAWSKAAIKWGQVVCVPEFLSNYRVHSKNLTNNTHLEIWMHDLRAFISLWEHNFAQRPIEDRAHLCKAASTYYNSFLTNVLLQGTLGLRGRLRTLVGLFRYRLLFRRPAGLQHLLLTLTRAFLPRLLDQPARRCYRRLATMRSPGLMR